MKSFVALRASRAARQSKQVGHPQLGRARRAFTLTEILVAMSIIGVLSALLFAVFGGGKETARRAQCDTHLKALAIALNAFREENGHYPARLEELVDKKYVTDVSLLRCPDDPNDNSAGYADYYVRRGTHNDPRFPRLTPIAELPTIVCPFHEADGHGAQAFAGTHTHQFATQPAELTAANATTIEHADKSSEPGVGGMKLHGGDLIVTGSGGMAAVRFADDSSCDIGPGSRVTLLQSFLAGGQSGLYTIVRQTVGDVNYTVHHGSKFDVSTPTATAGALGTTFTISIRGSAGGVNLVTNYQEKWMNTSVPLDSEVYCSTPGIITVIPRGVWWVPMGNGSTNTNPAPAPAPTPAPTATPTPTPKPDDDGDKGKGN